MSENLISCSNCENSYEEGFSFCPHCGQKTDDELTMRVLFYNTISNYFSFDARFLKGFLPLMFRPGFLPKKFIEGKRLLYLHPGQMYLFVAFILFFVFSFFVNRQASDLDKALQRNDTVTISKDSISGLNSPLIDSIRIDKALEPIKANKDLLGLKDEELKVMDSIIKAESKDRKKTSMNFDFDQNKVDSLLAVNAKDEVIFEAMGMNKDAGFVQRKFFSQMLKFYKSRGLGAIFQTFYDSLPIAMFFLLPVFAFILKLLFFRRGRYAHHLVFSLYFFSFLFTTFLLLYFINYLVDIPDWIDWLVVLSTFFYLYLAIKRFYQQGWFISFIKTGLTTFIFLLFVAPMTATIVAILSFMLY